jgi:hypothetical protein
MRFGIYFYPWYCARRWGETARLLTSVKGEYDSSDPGVAGWQVEQIARCGFDYVVFELVPIRDWGFDLVDRAIEGMIPMLRERDLGWSFLMDSFVTRDPLRALPEMNSLVQHVEQRGWTEGLVEGPSGRPLLLCFFPVPDVARGLTRLHPGYELRYPAYFPHWGDPDQDLARHHMTPWKECRDLARCEGTTLFDTLAPLGYVSFFETTPEKRNFGGFVSAIPAFDDRHQRRDPDLVPAIPVVPAQGGRTIRHEIEAAAATSAEHMLVYGWNEYFENAVVEPSREEGALTAESCRVAIAALRTSAGIYPGPPTRW